MGDMECSFLPSPSENGALTVSGQSQSGMLNNSVIDPHHRKPFFQRVVNHLCSGHTGERQTLVPVLVTDSQESVDQIFQLFVGEV